MDEEKKVQKEIEKLDSEITSLIFEMQALLNDVSKTNEQLQHVKDLQQLIIQKNYQA